MQYTVKYPCIDREEFNVDGMNIVTDLRRGDLVTIIKGNEEFDITLTYMKYEGAMGVTVEGYKLLSDKIERHPYVDIISVKNHSSERVPFNLYLDTAYPEYEIDINNPTSIFHAIHEVAVEYFSQNELTFNFLVEVDAMSMYNFLVGKGYYDTKLPEDFDHLKSVVRDNFSILLPDEKYMHKLWLKSTEMFIERILWSSARKSEMELINETNQIFHEPVWVIEVGIDGGFKLKIGINEFEDEDVLLVFQVFKNNEWENVTVGCLNDLVSIIADISNKNCEVIDVNTNMPEYDAYVNVIMKNLMKSKLGLKIHQFSSKNKKMN